MVEIKRGKIRYSRNELKEKNRYCLIFEKKINNIRIILERILINLTIFNTAKNKEFLKMWQLAPAFYYSWEYNTLSTIIILSAVLFDENSKNSFQSLLNYAKSYRNRIFDKSFKRIYVYTDGTSETEEIEMEDEKVVFDKIDAMILDNFNTIQTIKEYRDKRYAHIDKKPPSSKLFFDDILKFVKLVESMLIELSVRYNGVIISCEPMDSDDIKNINYVVNMYEKHKTKLLS